MSGSISERREAIEPIVEERQQELRAALEELQSVVLSRLDPAEHIARRPLPWIAGGVLFGFWLGSRRG